MDLDDVLDSPRVHLVARIVFVAVALSLTWALTRHSSADSRFARVCRGVYAHARTPAESAAVDTSHTIVRAHDGTLVLSPTCGAMRRAGKLE